MDRWAGRVAVVTGASSGIGARIAQDLVRAGLVVVGVARRRDLLTEMAASLAKEGASGRMHAVQADLSNVDEVRRVFQWVEEHVGGVSIVVNNAAISIPKPIQDLEAAEMQAIVSTNLTSVMVACKEGITSMKSHGIKDGHIINMNSVTGHVILNPSGEGVSASAYSTTKHGITALSNALRFDVQKMQGFKIRITSVSPGVVRTDMVPEHYIKYLPHPVLEAADISSAVVYALTCPATVEISELIVRPVGQNF